MPASRAVDPPLFEGSQWECLKVKRTDCTLKVFWKAFLSFLCLSAELSANQESIQQNEQAMEGLLN